MTEQNLSELVINKVESQEVYESIKSQGLINANELYLVSGSPWKVYEEVTLTEAVSTYLYTFPTSVKKARITIWPKASVAQGWRTVTINGYTCNALNPAINANQGFMVTIDSTRENGWYVESMLIYMSEPFSNGINCGAFPIGHAGNMSAAQKASITAGITSIGSAQAAVLPSGAYILVEAIP